MKHNLKVTLILITFFVFAQITGLYLLNKDMNVKTVEGEPTPSYSETSLGQRPALEGGGTFLYLLFGIAIGTGLIL